MLDKPEDCRSQRIFFIQQGSSQKALLDCACQARNTVPRLNNTKLDEEIQLFIP